MKKPNTQNKKTTTWLKLKVKILTDTLCHIHVKYVLIVNMLLLFWSLSMKNMPIYFSINISSICNTLVNKHTANLLVFCQKFTLELPPSSYSVCQASSDYMKITDLPLNPHHFSHLAEVNVVGHSIVLNNSEVQGAFHSFVIRIYILKASRH